MINAKQLKLVLFVLFFSSCTNDNSKMGYKIEYYPNGNTYRYFPLNEKGQKEGGYLCYYDNGRLKTLGAVVKDSILINEEISFDKNGRLQEYSFYNIDGEKRFHRIYDSLGSVSVEEGDFFAYTDINRVELMVGDSLKVFCYLANPPCVLTDVYLLNNNRRTYHFKKEAKFTHYLTKRMKRSGSYIMFIEAEFKDLITGKVETRKDSIYVRVY